MKLLVCIAFSFLWVSVAVAATAPVKPYPTKGVVVRVYDGDTILVRSPGQPADVTVRLVEADTPEIHRPGTPVQCFGPEAYQYTKAHLQYGTVVRLATDPLLDKVDRYNRLLAYVYLPRTNWNLNLVRYGYAHAYHYLGARGTYARSFDLAEATAKRLHRGFWSPKTCNGDTKKPETELGK